MPARDGNGKQLSGAQKRKAAKNAQRDAERYRSLSNDATDGLAASCAKLGGVPKDAEAGHSWLAQVMLLVIQDAINDMGLAPENRREQIGRLVGQAAKVMDPAKLSAKLALYEEALEKLNAAPVGRRENAAARPPASLD